jgi:predicted regulator of Ras-like GTPase activity (Roadblock/LC7/MglB family)/DNA-binding NarL/FixJ family response regulator
MNKKILVAVEDHALRARFDGLLNDLARATGRSYAVSHVGSPAVALYQASRSRFDLVIMALAPAGRTLDLLLRLRDIYPALPILLLHKSTSDSLSERVADARMQSAEPSATNETLQRLIRAMLGLGVEPTGATLPVDEAKPQLSSEQRAMIWERVRRLERAPGVELVLVADSSGEPIAHWAFHRQVDVAQMALLAATTLATTVELNHRFGGSDVSSLVIKEIEEQTVLIARAEENLVALIVLNRRAPLGWGRVALKRLIEELRHTIGSSGLLACVGESQARERR